MFSIFSYIMSRVTHSEPGLPMDWHARLCIATLPFWTAWFFIRTDLDCFPTTVTMAVLVSQTSPVEVELLSYVNTFFCSKFKSDLNSWWNIGHAWYTWLRGLSGQISIFSDFSWWCFLCIQVPFTVEWRKKLKNWRFCTESLEANVGRYIN